jgi:ubiquinone/menaquinone biosynthesis C-methylase UbiE
MLALARRNLQSTEKEVGTMPALDPYHITDKLDDAILDVIVTRLESRGKHPRFQSMLDDYLDCMAIDSAGSVLDMGCGTGVAARAIAARTGFSGKVLGIDLSPYLVGVAGRLADEEGLGARIDFQEGDTQSLGLANEAFDAVVAHTLLSHVSDPLAVLGEAKRVVRPGGFIGVFDGDYASITFEQEDPEKAKADDEKIINAIVTQPRVMRQLPRLAKAAGLDLVKPFPYVLAEFGQANFWLSAIESFRKLVPKSGAMSEPEAETWINAMLKSSEEGTFFAATNYYGYVLRRP